MKKHLSILTLVFLAACAKPVELKTYTLIIYGKEPNTLESDLPVPLEKYPIRVANDTAAFQRGVKEFYSRLMLEETATSTVSRATSFDVIDDTGEALSEKLNVRLPTELRKRVKEHAKVLKSRH
jgi:hypothetical protein